MPTACPSTALRAVPLPAETRGGFGPSIRQRDLVFPERVAIGFEAALAAFQADQRALRYRCGPGRILGDQWAQRLLVPSLAVTDVEDRVDVEIAALASTQAEPTKRASDADGAAWRGQLDGAERA